MGTIVTFSDTDRGAGRGELCQHCGEPADRLDRVGPIILTIGEPLDQLRIAFCC
jgi:hypothetical protein